MAVFETEVTLPVTQQELFTFLTRPENLPQLSAPDVGLKFLKAPEQLQSGDTVQFAVQTMGQIQKMTHRITLFDEPYQFAEEQIEGPLTRWIHTHTFTAASDHETLMTDRIEFDPPSGIIGMFLTESKILEHLEDAYYYRQEQLKKLFR